MSSSPGEAIFFAVSASSSLYSARDMRGVEADFTWEPKGVPVNAVGVTNAWAAPRVAAAITIFMATWGEFRRLGD